MCTLATVKSTQFAKAKQLSKKEIQFYSQIIVCDPLICTMDYPNFFNQIRRKNLLVYKEDYDFYIADSGSRVC